MSTAKDRVLEREFNAARALAAPMGKADAEALQLAAPSMSGTELNGSAAKIPMFTEAVKVKNMMEREAGELTGFVCMSSARRVVRLRQKYDSNVHRGEPEEYPALWKWVWSKDPAHARPFIKSAENYYEEGDCYTWGLEIYASTYTGNTYSPEEYPAGSRLVGRINPDTGEIELITEG